VPRGLVARWPYMFPPEDYDLGKPIDCPSSYLTGRGSARGASGTVKRPQHIIGTQRQQITRIPAVRRGLRMLDRQFVAVNRNRLTAQQSIDYGSPYLPHGVTVCGPVVGQGAGEHRAQIHTSR
jgi:hypothetical protein